MKFPQYLLALGVTLLFTGVAFAHEGHGQVGTVAHDLQHHLWNFAGLVLLGAALLGGEQIAALVSKKRKEKDE
jgi:hypothetical protein